MRLSSYTIDPITIAGELKVTVSDDKQCQKLTLYVVEGGGPCLLGRGWLQQVRLHWKNSCSVKAEGKSQMEQLQWVLDYPNSDYPYPNIWTSALVAMFSAAVGKTR